MATYSIEVSGPSARLAMLRALAHRTLGRLTHLVTTTKLILSRSTHLARTVSSGILAVLGSTTGYHLVRHTARTVLRSAVSATRSALSVLGHQASRVAGVIATGISVVSPAAADYINDAAHRWVLTPVSTTADRASSWAREFAAVLWQLTGTSLVATTTVRAAQSAAIVLAAHSLTRGAAASRIVRAVPSAMDLVIIVTNPTRTLALVATAFTGTLLIAALRLLHRPEQTPTPDTDPATPVSSINDEHVGQSRAQGRRREALPRQLAEVVSRLNIEIASDGAVEVHGIPGDIPRETGEEIARIAAEAATARLERLLLHRPMPNRDDRRLLTKVAREAVRAQATRPISA